MSDYLSRCAEKFKRLQGMGELEGIRDIVRSLSYGVIKTDYELRLHGCLQEGDMKRLNDLIFQQTRYELMLGSSGGYYH